MTLRLNAVFPLPAFSHSCTGNHMLRRAGQLQMGQQEGSTTPKQPLGTGTRPSKGQLFILGQMPPRHPENIHVAQLRQKWFCG